MVELVAESLNKSNENHH